MNNLIIILIAVLAVMVAVAIIAIFMQHKAQKDLEERLDKAEQSLAVLHQTLKELHKKIEQYRQSDKADRHTEYVERRQYVPRNPEASPATVAPAAPKPKAVQKDCYFGTPKGDAEMALFNDLYEELRDECFFAVHFTDTDKAEYEPIDLMRLKSLPALEGVVRYDGCPLSEARAFQLKTKGVVQRQNNYWVVISPAELQLTK